MQQMDERTNELQRKSSAIKEMEVNRKQGKMTEREKMIKKEMDEEND